MTANESFTQTTRFKIGWIVLLILSVLFLLQHLVLIFAIFDEAVLFIGWSAFNLVSALVLYIPFRRGERWAWFATWIQAIAYAVMIAFDQQIGLMYLIAAGTIALMLFLTAPAFFRRT